LLYKREVSVVVAAAVVACETAFWVSLLAGLTVRYAFTRSRLGAALLWVSPLADCGLLTVTAVDLHAGAEVTQVHALAAVYLGVSVAFGAALVSALDDRFAHRFLGRTLPPKPARTGAARAEHEWREFRRAVLAWAISCGVLLGLVGVVWDINRSRVLLGYIGVLTVVLLAWLLVGPLAAFVLARRERHREPAVPRSAAARRWAPWWSYLVLILAANYGRQAVVPADAIPNWVDAAIAIALAAVMFVAITAAFRAMARDRSPRT
jgi:hypothetical protein